MELADIGLDEEEQARPVTVEPAKPAGLRNLVIGLGVVAGLILAAIAIGKSGDKPSATAATTTTSSSVATNPTTTSTIPPPSTLPWLQLVPKGALLPTKSATALYGETPQQQLVRVDLDTGAVTIRNVPLGQDNPVQVIPRGDKIVVTSSASPMLVLNADLTGPAKEIDLDSGTQIYAGPGDDLWAVHDQGDDPSAPERTFQRVHVDGTPAGPLLALPPGSVTGADDAGRLQVYSYVAAYTAVLDPNTGQPTRLAAGSPVGMNAKLIVDISCDAHLVCQWRVTDRASGATRVLPGQVSNEVLTSGGGGSVSADGRWLAYLLSPGDVLVIDLDTGQERRFSEARLTAYWGLLPTWSADSKWLFWAGGDNTYVWSAGAAGAQKLGDGSLPAMTNLVAVPTGRAS
jgi:hypothetical protein